MRDACNCVLRTSQPVREPSERLVRGEQFEMPFPLGAIPALCVMSRQRERCTAREVTSFFVRVNADDELYLPDPRAKRRGKGADELDYDEFEEIVCRICREKLPPPEEGGKEGGAPAVPFEQSLDTWLGLVFIPAL